MNFIFQADISFNFGQDFVDPEPSAATLNVTDDQTNAAPCSTTELPKEMISLSEANPVSLTSINQGMILIFSPLIYLEE